MGVGRTADSSSQAGWKPTSRERARSRERDYVQTTGCQWRALPKELPPRSTVHDYLDWWSYDGTLDRIHHALYVRCREQEQEGREASPTTAIIDSQSMKSTEKGGANIDPHGYDAGKKIKGKKRHLLVDTVDLLLHAIVHPANIQDRDGGILLLSTLLGRYPFLKTRFADAGYQGPQFQKAKAKILPHVETEIVKRSEQAGHKFVVLPRRWIIERTIAWLNRCRRLAKDWENLNRTALAFPHLASGVIPK
jgi:putative transposase